MRLLSPAPGLLLVGLAATASGHAQAAAPLCTEWAEPVLLATCDSVELDESSGLAPDALRPSTWLTHNDAGGDAELYAFDESGTHIETHELTGASFRDWEALASGPCPLGVPGESCLFVGDVGDNGESRDEVEVLVTGPVVGGGSVPVQTRWRLRYPDRAHDAEAIAVHPCTGEVIIVTKEREGDPQVYRLPPEPTDVDRAANLEWVASLPAAWFEESGLVTGADWSDTGARFVLRTYGGAWIWEADPADPDAHWETEPTRVPIDTEGQGEAIAFHPDGGLLTTTERVPMRISRLACAASTPAPECPPPEPVDTGTPEDSGVVVDSGGGGEEGDGGEPDDSGESAGGPDDEPDTTPEGSAAAGAGAPSKDDTACGGAAAAWLCLLGLSLRRRARTHAAGGAGLR